MHRLLLSLISLTILTVTTSGQNSIAKLKYEEAEEAYSKADYPTALNKLAEAEKLLGSINPKILYLKIVSGDKQVSQSRFVDPEAVAKLMEDCRFYLTQYENIDGIEEKYRNIYKISESLNQHKDKAELYKNATQGNIESIVKLGMLYDYRDPDKAIEWLSKAAAKGNMKALHMLAHITLLQKKNPRKAYEIYSEAVQKGDATSAAGIAYMYEQGYPDFPQDKIKGFEWLLRSADMGSLQSKRAIGTQYLHDSMPIHVSKVLSILTEAISAIPKDHSDSTSITFSYFSLAEIYFLGKDSIPKDYAKAVMLLEKGYKIAPSHITRPKIGYITCRDYLLGMMYKEGGYGIQADPIKAFKHFYATAIQYSEESVFLKYKEYKKYWEESMQNLAEMYAKGLGVNKDKSLAKEWAQKAANVAAK